MISFSHRSGPTLQHILKRQNHFPPLQCWALQLRFTPNKLLKEFPHSQSFTKSFRVLIVWKRVQQKRPNNFREPNKLVHYYYRHVIFLVPRNYLAKGLNRRVHFLNSQQKMMRSKCQSFVSQTSNKTRNVFNELIMAVFNLEQPKMSNAVSCVLTYYQNPK